MSAAIDGLDRHVRRRAALRAALRRGDAIAAARAWERLRIDADGIAWHERAAARAARVAVGRAIRDARRRRALAPAAMDAGATDIAAASPTVLARYRGALSASAILVFLLALFVPRPAEELAPAAAAPELVTTIVPAASLAPSGRGRTSASAQPVADLESPPPSAVPTPSAPAAPAASPSGVAGGTAGGATGGVVGGATGGAVGGTLGGTGTKTLPPAPTPTPAPAINLLPVSPVPLPPGADRFLFRVVDSRTGVPLSQVCVVYGTTTCGPSDPHTNVLGYYWFDLDPTMATAWNFRFFLDPDYFSATVDRTYRPSMGTSPTTVLLHHK